MKQTARFDCSQWQKRPAIWTASFSWRNTHPQRKSRIACGLVKDFSGIINWFNEAESFLFVEPHAVKHNGASWRFSQRSSTYYIKSYHLLFVWKSRNLMQSCLSKTRHMSKVPLGCRPSHSSTQERSFILNLIDNNFYFSILWFCVLSLLRAVWWRLVHSKLRVWIASTLCEAFKPKPPHPSHPAGSSADSSKTTRICPVGLSGKRCRRCILSETPLLNVKPFINFYEYSSSKN